MNNKVKIAVMSPGAYFKDPRPEGEIRFGEAQKPLHAFFRSVPLPEGRRTVKSMVVERSPFITGMTNQPVLSIRFSGETFDLQIGQSAPAVAALQQCESDLLAKWGMSIADQALVATSPQGEVRQFFDPTDYPDDALRAGRTGVTGARYWVGVDGRLSDCHVTLNSGTASIDRQTCAILEARARLTPARDRENRAIRSLSSRDVVWSLPNE